MLEEIEAREVQDLDKGEIANSGYEIKEYKGKADRRPSTMHKFLRGLSILQDSGPADAQLSVLSREAALIAIRLRLDAKARRALALVGLRWGKEALTRLAHAPRESLT